MAEPTQAQVDALISAEDRATKDSNYADAVKFDAQQITETRYRIRLSEAEPER